MATKPEKKTVAIPTLFGEREVAGEVYGGWVVVHRSWAAADKSPWVVAMLPAGCWLARRRLKAEARAIAEDVAETFKNLAQMVDHPEVVGELCQRHGIHRGPVGPARKVLGYERCHIGHREVWE